MKKPGKIAGIKVTIKPLAKSEIPKAMRSPAAEAGNKWRAATKKAGK